MPYWGFFAIKNHSFVGLTNEKVIKSMIIKDRSEDFDYIKLKKEPTAGMIADYSFYPEEISSGVYVPMTRGEEEGFYAFGCLRLLKVIEIIEDVKKHIRILRLDKVEEQEFLKSIINIYEHLYSVMESSDDFGEKAWGCTNAFNKVKIWNEFREYKREEDETLENLYAMLMSM